MRIQSLPFAPSFLSFQTISRSYPPVKIFLFPNFSSKSRPFVLSHLIHQWRFFCHFHPIFHQHSPSFLHQHFPDTFWEFQTVQTSNLGEKKQGPFHHFHSLLTVDRYLEEFQNQTPRPFVSSWSPIFSRTSAACPATPLRGRCRVSCCSCRSCRRSCGGGWWWGWKAGSTAGGWRFLQPQTGVVQNFIFFWGNFLWVFTVASQKSHNLGGDDFWRFPKMGVAPSHKSYMLFSWLFHYNIL